VTAPHEAAAGALFSPPMTVPLPTPLTPESLANLYPQLPVTYRNPVTGSLAIAQCSPCIYANTQVPDRVPNRNAVLHLRAQVNEFAAGRDRRLASALSGADRRRIARAFNGHGRPADMAFTLSLALSCDVTTPAAVNRYCHDVSIGGLGLDCVGFVQSYFELRHGFIPGSAIPYYRVADLQRWTAADIRPDDVLIWDSDDRDVADHIAVVSSAAGAASCFRVGESTGSFGGPSPSYAQRAGGVSISTYRFSGPNASGSFQVTRNLGGRELTNNVSVYGVARPG
jgi:hypothetical protein